MKFDIWNQPGGWNLKFEINLVGEIQISLKLRLDLSSPVSLKDFLKLHAKDGFKVGKKSGTSSMIYHIWYVWNVYDRQINTINKIYKWLQPRLQASPRFFGRHRVESSPLQKLLFFSFPLFVSQIANISTGEYLKQQISQTANMSNSY